MRYARESLGRMLVGAMQAIAEDGDGTDQEKGTCEDDEKKKSGEDSVRCENLSVEIRLT